MNILQHPNLINSSIKDRLKKLDNGIGGEKQMQDQTKQFKLFK